MPDKQDVAALLAKAHVEIEPSLERIVRLVSPNEDEAGEPVKLLEVTRETSASGIVPVAFGADPPGVPYPSVVVEVTPEEYEQIRAGTLSLPSGWKLDVELHPRAA